MTAVPGVWDLPAECYWLSFECALLCELTPGSKNYPTLPGVSLISDTLFDEKVFSIFIGVSV